jgi:hypothetical protein
LLCNSGDGVARVIISIHADYCGMIILKKKFKYQEEINMAGLIEWDDDFFLISRMFEVCTSNDAGIFIFAGENKSFLSSS